MPLLTDQDPILILILILIFLWSSYDFGLLTCLISDSRYMNMVEDDDDLTSIHKSSTIYFQKLVD